MKKAGPVVRVDFKLGVNAVNTSFVAEKPANFKPFHKDFWRQNPRRTAILRRAQEDDNLLLWDVQGPSDHAERERRIQILESLGFDRWILTYRDGHLGHRHFPAGKTRLFVHREAGVENAEDVALRLREFGPQNYVLPGLFHLSAYEFWDERYWVKRALVQPDGSVHVPMEALMKLKRPMKPGIERALEDEAWAREENAEDEDVIYSLSPEEERRLAAYDQKERLREVRAKRERRLNARKEWADTNVSYLDRWLKQQANIKPSDAPLEPFTPSPLRDGRARLPDLSVLSFADILPDRDENYIEPEPAIKKVRMLASAHRKPVVEAPPPFPVVDASTLAGKPIPPRLWHVEGMIPTATVTLLNGDGGTGKSLLSLQLAVATTVGFSWLGLPTTQGDCLFLTAEDDLDEVHRRLADIVRAYGIRLDDLGGLTISSLAGEDALLAAPEGKSNIVKPTKLFAALEARIEAARPTFVVLDTLADLFGGEENQRAQARQFISLLRGLSIRYSTTILLLAHPSLSGMASGTGSSGSTGWNNSVRSRLYFERAKGEDGAEDDPDARVLKMMKANYGRTGATLRLRWQGGVFVKELSRSFGKGADGTSDAERIFLDLLAAYTVEGRHVSETPSANYAPTVFSRDPRSNGINRVVLRTAMNTLFANERIVVVENGPPSKRRKRISLVRNEGDDASAADDVGGAGYSDTGLSS